MREGRRGTGMADRIKKTDIVRQAVKSGDFKQALKLAKGFRINITKEQHDIITRAYECMVHPDFYRQIGTDIDGTIEAGKSTMVLLYG